MSGASRTAAQFEMMLFVTCAKVWKQQNTDGSMQWACVGIVHPFLQTDPSFSTSPGHALLDAYNAWKQQNAKTGK